MKIMKVVMETMKMVKKEEKEQKEEKEEKEETEEKEEEPSQVETSQVEPAARMGLQVELEWTTRREIMNIITYPNLIPSTASTGAP
jgi:hypothetical protein